MLSTCGSCHGPSFDDPHLPVRCRAWQDRLLASWRITTRDGTADRDRNLVTASESGRISRLKGGQTLVGRGSFSFFSSTESLMTIGGLATTGGFFFTIGTGLGRAASLGSTGVGSRNTATGRTATVAVDRGSPRRLSRTDFSAYSLI